MGGLERGGSGGGWRGVGMEELERGGSWGGCRGVGGWIGVGGWRGVGLAVAIMTSIMVGQGLGLN